MQSTIYSLKWLSTSDGWEDVFGKALAEIEAIGVNENKFSAATFNYTEDDQRSVALLSWSKVHEDHLND